MGHKHGRYVGHGLCEQPWLYDVPSPLCLLPGHSCPHPDSDVVGLSSCSTPPILPLCNCLFAVLPVFTPCPPHKHVSAVCVACLQSERLHSAGSLSLVQMSAATGQGVANLLPCVLATHESWDSKWVQRQKEVKWVGRPGTCLTSNSAVSAHLYSVNQSCC